MTGGFADRLRFLLARIRERLWVKPLAVCVVSVAAVFAAKLADGTGLDWIVPVMTADSVENLLSVMAASMLVIATFSVASMVSAYASAASGATPRAFSLVLADDVSQNALSTFIGAFIFSIVGSTAARNDYFDVAGRFTLFALTVFVFAVVILTFVRWVDRIARLGRLGTTIEKVEAAAAAAMRQRRDTPHLRGVPVTDRPDPGAPVFAECVGYVQNIDVQSLQACAAAAGGRVTVAALPGTFASPERPLAYVDASPDSPRPFDHGAVARAFVIGAHRRFDDDPRFGLVVLAEIAGRALSPAVNDPGTAIGIVGCLVRLFASWHEPAPSRAANPRSCDRVEVPAISIRDMFDDAFTPIARDGAGSVEVMVRLQKALRSLAAIGDTEMRNAAIHHARLARERARKALTLPDDLARVEAVSGFAGTS